MRAKSAKVSMFDYQTDALKNMKNGCILCGGVGTGKSRTSLAYFYLQHGGEINTVDYKWMTNPRDLYIITTARKRDLKEWEEELIVFNMCVDQSISIYPKQKIVIDSWNNIKKYANVTGAFFIFDEQRLVGSGAWVKAFLKIAKRNKWILLSATPGDCWSDYIPVFVANGFYKNKTEFLNRHAVYARFSKFPKIEKFIETGRLQRMRNDLLVDMHLNRTTKRHYNDVILDYDKKMYGVINKNRWDPYKNVPIENPSMLCYLLRKVCNSDVSRQIALLDLTKKHERLIVFYNFDYELDILKKLPYDKNITVAEWNGHKHEDVPHTKRWVYLVQYTSGCEGWNCITTNATVFYSQNYSYKVMEQASGRIDRVNTRYIDLFYYVFKSRSSIDMAVARAIKNKKKFNENAWGK